MSDRLSKGPIQVFGNDVPALNYAFQQVQTEIDEIRGLRGRILLNDRAKVSDPSETSDAVNLGTRDASDVVTQSLGRMSYLSDAVYYTDVNSTVLHGFGNVP